MSEILKKTSPTRPDPLSLSALLASRLCHDLVNPVGAFSAGLQVLEDPDMRDEALEIMQTSAAKSVALLKFARIAYGAAGSFDGDIPLNEARQAAEGLYGALKDLQLDWQTTKAGASKEVVKILMTFLHAASEFVPRGGHVTLTEADNIFTIAVTGKRIFVSESFIDSLDATPEALTPKQSPVFIATLIAQEIGAQIRFDSEEKLATIVLDFSDVNTA